MRKLQIKWDMLLLLVAIDVIGGVGSLWAYLSGIMTPPARFWLLMGVIAVYNIISIFFFHPIRVVKEKV